MLYTNTIETGTLELLKNISSHSIFSNFYLACGTALALQIGHRKTKDLDYFCSDSFDESIIINFLKTDFQATLFNQYQNTDLICNFWRKIVSEFIRET